MAEKPTQEYFVAIDIGSYALKFAYILPGVDGAKPTLKVLVHMLIPQFTQMLTPEEREKMSREDVEKDAIAKLQKFLTKHLTELLYDNQISGKRAVSLASGRSVTIRYMEIPQVLEKEKLTQAVNLEASKQMPFSMENAVLGYTVLGNITRDEKSHQQVVVGALQKEIVGLLSEYLKGGGLTNEGILTLSQSLELALGSQLASPPDKPDFKVAIIHSGHKITSIMIYKNGLLHFYRDINIAGETITEAIFAGGEIDGEKISFSRVDEAIKLKHSLGIVPPDEIQGLKGVEKFAAGQIFSSVEKLFQHIQLSISFYISQFGESGIDRVILSGGSAAMKNFKEYIQECLEVPVEVSNPLSNLVTTELQYPADKLQSDLPSLAPSIGMGQYRNQAEIINFLDILFPDRHKKVVDFSQVGSKFSEKLSKGLGISFKLDEKRIKIIAGLLGVLLLIAVVFPFVRIRRDLNNAKDSLKKMQGHLASLMESQTEVTQILEEKEMLTKEAGFPDEIQRLRFPNSEMLLELAQKTPSQIFVNSLKFYNEGAVKKFRLAGQTFTSDQVFGLIATFSNAKFLKSLSLESSEEVSIDQTNYFIRFSVVGVIEKHPPTPPFNQIEKKENE